MQCCGFSSSSNVSLEDKKHVRNFASPNHMVMKKKVSEDKKDLCNKKMKDFAYSWWNYDWVHFLVWDCMCEKSMQK